MSHSVSLVLFLCLFLFTAYVGLALIPAFIARKRGYGFAGFFLLSLLFSFLIGLIVALCLPNRRAEMQELKAAIAAVAYVPPHDCT